MMKYYIPESIRNADSEQIVIIEWENNSEDIECFEKLISNYSEIQIKNISKKKFSFFANKYNNSKKKETKIKSLAEIVLHYSVESYRFLEKENENKLNPIYPFIKIALLLSKNFLEQSLLDNNSFVPIFIFSGLGGKGNKIKYFISLRYEKILMPNEAKFILLELSKYILSKYNAEIEFFDTSREKLFFFIFVEYNIKALTVVEDIEKFLSKITLNKLKSIKVSNDKEEVKTIIIKEKCVLW